LLSGKTILITGANGGIGSSISNLLLENNAKLILLFNKNRNQIDDLIKNKPNLKSNVELYSVDLCDANSLEKTLSKILENNIVDVFIHSVSPSIVNKQIQKVSWKDFNLHMNLEVQSFLQIVQKLIPNMKTQQNGKIISILSSYTVGKPPPQLTAYVSTKYALLGLMKSLAVELGNSGITVNGISPSMTETPLIDNLPRKLKEIKSKQNPLGRLAKPNDISSLVLFLCSKHCNYISGENILITGAENMH
jgi:3-oxoacyl-[acyl-carrier protein] reductase